MHCYSESIANNATCSGMPKLHLIDAACDGFCLQGFDAAQLHSMASATGVGCFVCL